MSRIRYVPKDFGAGEAPVSSDLLGALAYIQEDASVRVIFTLEVKMRAQDDPYYAMTAVALAGDAEPPGTLYAPISAVWPNVRHRTLSACLYRMALDLDESVASQRDDRLKR